MSVAVLSIKCIVRVLLHRCIKKQLERKQCYADSVTLIFTVIHGFIGIQLIVYSVCIPTLFLHEHVHIICI